MKKWKKTIYIGLIVLFAVIFLVSSIRLADYYIKAYRADKTYSQLAQMVQQAQQTLPTQESLPQEQTEPAQQLHRWEDPDTGRVQWLLPEYVHVYSMNQDMVGWIYVEGTRINYPVMHHPGEKDYYLYRDFHKEYSLDGAIYIREQCDVFKPTDNVTIYGHRMNSGSMFADLLKYKDAQFYAEHPYIRFDTIQQRQTYEILSVFTISASENNGFAYHRMADAQDQAEFDAFVAQCKDRALYDTGVDAVYGDKLITLSTCEKGNSNYRVVVVAKRISQ